MSTQAICLTWSVLVERIEEVLKDCPEPFSQVVLSHPAVLQKLISSVLVQLPDCHLARNPGTICFSSQENLQVDDLIRQSLFQVVQRNPDWIACQNSSHSIIKLEVQFTCPTMLTTKQT